MRTELKNRTLWYDGSITVDSLTKLLNLVKCGVPCENLFIDSTGEEVEQYNKLVKKSNTFTKKTECEDLYFEWNIPEHYKNLNIKQYLIEKLISTNLESNDCKDRLSRMLYELKLYEARDLCVVLRTIIYIINTLEENDVVWGVGRGSSVSSYILYLIGVHDVDSFKYNLNIEDFIS